jgi:hypothetical protein
MIDAQDIEALKLIPVLGVLPRIQGAGVNAQAGPPPLAKGGAPGAL